MVKALSKNRSSLHGTAPTFLKVPMTSELSAAVKAGRPPLNPTDVLIHTPDLEFGAESGMKELVDRRHVVRCYEAFKRFV